MDGTGKPTRRRVLRRSLYAGIAALIGLAAVAAVPLAASATMTSSSHASAAAAYTPPKRTLRLGMKGADVKALQQRLAQLKYYPGTADGTFGNDTLEAVWAFQEVQGLGVDGSVGPMTGHALASPRTYQAHDPRGGSLRVEVNLGTRVLILYNHSQIELISHVSSGGGYYFCNPGGGCSYAITPTGQFRTTVYMPGWVTVPLGEMYNPVFFIGTAYAIHGDTDVPLQPVSHGCVRIPMDIAAFFHTLVPTPPKAPSTPVYIYS
jgi:peptidoglycan hydrolase-like protein with peptidoglycan-binding domain